MLRVSFASRPRQPRGFERDIAACLVIPPRRGDAPRDDGRFCSVTGIRPEDFFPIANGPDCGVCSRPDIGWTNPESLNPTLTAFLARAASGLVDVLTMSSRRGRLRPTFLLLCAGSTTVGTISRIRSLGEWDGVHGFESPAEERRRFILTSCAWSCRFRDRRGESDTGPGDCDLRG